MSVIVNLGVLGFFKYCGFFIENFSRLLHMLGLEPNPPTLKVILPIGISFYTFMSMSYTIDVYRGKISAERSLLRFATFVSFFPHLVAGPILRPERFLVQLKNGPMISWDGVIEGVGWMLLGYIKKVVVADSLAPYVDLVFAEPALQAGISILAGVVFYAFQIYGDFSGYSDIAYGVAKIMGYDIGRNFAQPYFSTSFSEFWQRWHISLSSWLRDYLYIPLGGNRFGVLMTYRNLFLTMLLGGLWHGANWTFVVWGALHGLYLVLQRVCGRPLAVMATSLRIPKSAQSLLAATVVFGSTCFAWVFFRSQDFSMAYLILSKCCSPEILTLNGLTHKFWVVKGSILVALLLGAEFLSQFYDVRRKLLNSVPFRVGVFAFCLCLIAFAGTFSGERFIYFQF